MPEPKTPPDVVHKWRWMRASGEPVPTIVCSLAATDEHADGVTYSWNDVDCSDCIRIGAPPYVKKRHLAPATS